MKINQASYIGKPQDHTVMYLTKKVQHLISALEAVQGCLVFVETGVDIASELRDKHTFIITDTPQKDYTQYVIEIEKEKQQVDLKREYQLVDGSWIGENVTIGKDAIIQPGCVIGHDVVIGKNAYIATQSVIKNAVIGDYFYANEGAKIGMNGFTMTKDEYGNTLRIPTLGDVKIGHHVEVGVNCNISRGSAGSTVLHDYVKLDALVYIAHDVEIKTNTEMAGHVIIGGFSQIGANNFFGFNATVKNRIVIGDNCIIGMGANVLSNVDNDSVVVGNPAYLLKNREK